MLEIILNGLWNNWMFRLSLSSNELFHSNFLQTVLSDPMSDLLDEHAGATSWECVQDLAGWVGLDAAWLAERQAAYAGCPVFVYREWKKLDLAVVVRVPRANRGYDEVFIFAVELKVKSYPTLEQVERYLDLMKSHNGAAPFIPRLALLSLVKPPEHIRGVENLTVSDFGRVAQGIGNLVLHQPSLQAAIEEYAHLCQLLQQLSDVWSASLTPRTSLHSVTGQADVYRRLNPIWSKLCAARLCELVKKEMAGFVPAGGLELEATPDFSRSTWKADFLWCARPVGNGGGEVIAKAGVQVEGNTVRFMLNAQNVGGRGDDARTIVETTLLAQAGASGLYRPLYDLYGISESSPEQQVEEVRAFWQHMNILRRAPNGLPTCGRGRAGFTLPGYNNSSTFGHADYRLALHPDATLEQISQLVCAALRGDYNTDGPHSFLAVLHNPAVFA